MRFLTFTDDDDEEFFVNVEHIITVKFKHIPTASGHLWEIVIISLRGEHLKTTTRVNDEMKRGIERQLRALT